MSKAETKTVSAAIVLLAAIGLASPALATEGKSEPVPGVDEDKTLSEQLDESKGVIDPPPIGDEGIHADVPNPDAGHDEEVIPPPGTPGGDPSVEPK
ncbi:MAG: hypothetical protein ACRECX_02375 [Methyloceanibacter sp.]|uniref:hypothetical protein n=1 Tax=Methyloceanibacter sp. TaxID=1965321 RepID=UPI003D6D74A7